MGTGIRYKIKKGKVYSNSSSITDVSANVATVPKIAVPISLLSTDIMGFFGGRIVTRFLFFFTIINPHLQEFLDSLSSTKRVITYYDIQKSVRASVCRVKSSLILLLFYFYFSVISSTLCTNNYNTYASILTLWQGF